MEAGLADAAYTGTLIVLNIGLDLFPPSHGTVIKPPTIDAWGLQALTWDSTRTATTLSDVGLSLLSGAVLLGPPTFELSLDEEALNGTLLGLEALATTGLVTFLLKNLTARARPTTMGPHGGEYNSFPSGHTSQSFAAATLLTIFAYEYDWLDDDTRWLVPTVTYGLAATTGYLRVASRRHWLTDVLVGAAVGTGVSYLTYALRTGD
jgi:membrane-associated phospholipid phosphatase